MKYYHIEISETGRYAFVPAEYGRYIRTHVCVLFVACPGKLCKAKKKEACISMNKLAKFDKRVPQIQVCKERLAAYQKYKREHPKVEASGKVIRMKGRKKA